MTVGDEARTRTRRNGRVRLSVMVLMRLRMLPRPMTMIVDHSLIIIVIISIIFITSSKIVVSRIICTPVILSSQSWELPDSRFAEPCCKDQHRWFCRVGAQWS